MASHMQKLPELVKGEGSVTEMEGHKDIKSFQVTLGGFFMILPCLGLGDLSKYPQIVAHMDKARLRHGCTVCAR